MCTDPTLQQAHILLMERIRPQAEQIDQQVDSLREALMLLARAGLLGLRVAPALGGRALPEREFRLFQELCARASGALALLQTQHQSACAFLGRAQRRGPGERLLPRLATGAETSGVAFSHLRRRGPPALRARSCPGGYLLEGQAAWVTGWGIFDRCVTAAVLPDGRALFCTHRLATGPQQRASAPIPLAAGQVSSTVTIDFQAFFVPEEDVLAIHPGDWIHHRDRANVARQAPFALGCAAAALDLLRPEGDLDSPRQRCSVRFENELSRCRQVVFAAMDHPEAVDAALEARAWAIDLAARAAHAAVVASAGAGNLLSHPAQRIYREALLFTVLAQTRPVREATLSRLASAPEPSA